MANPTLDQVRENPYVLDSPDFTVPKEVRLVTFEDFSSVPELSVQRILPNFWVRLFRKFDLLYRFFYAIQLLCASSGKNTVLIINGASFIFLFVGYLHKLPCFRNTTLLFWYTYLEYRFGTGKQLKFFPFVKFKTAWKESIVRGALIEYEKVVLWSRKQLVAHAEVFRLPLEKFVFLPYKANHSQISQRVEYNIPIDNFIFAGGNSKRDYVSLVEAVRGTKIPVIISTTDPNIKKQIGSMQRGLPYNDKTGKGEGIKKSVFDDSISNVIVLAAAEPAFAQLQAACRFVVVPTIYTGLKGTGEANFCNAMYHGKAVIAACSIAAEEYIIDGETGYVVPSGDVEGLRKRICELWNDPEKCREMGRKGHERVEQYMTHEKFMRRMLRFALVLGESKRH